MTPPTPQSERTDAELLNKLWEVAKVCNAAKMHGVEPDWCDEAVATLDLVKDRLAALSAQQVPREAIEGLVSYVGHWPGCYWHRSPRGPCTCGSDAAVAEYEQTKGTNECTETH